MTKVILQEYVDAPASLVETEEESNDNKKKKVANGSVSAGIVTISGIEIFPIENQIIKEDI